MRILIVTNMYPHEERPALGSFVFTQVNSLRDLGHEVDVYFFRGYKNTLLYLWACAEVFWKTWQTHYDIVHAHYGLSGFPALFSWRTPVVTSFHGSDILVGKVNPLIGRFVARHTHANIAVSEAIHRITGGYYLPCGIDTDLYKPMPKLDAKQQLNLQPDTQYVLFPFDPARKLKRHELALSAVALLAAQGHNIELLTVYNVPNSNMPLYYNAADALILTSASEGSPTCIKEAMACNLPIVTVDVGDSKLLVEGAEAAFISASEPAELAKNLLKALSVPESQINSRDLAINRFGVMSIARDIADIYQSLRDNRVREMRQA